MTALLSDSAASGARVPLRTTAERPVARSPHPRITTGEICDHGPRRHRPRRPRRRHQPPPLRPLRRAPRPLHLRRLLGRRGLADPERARHPARRRRGAAGARHPEPPLAGRLLRRRVPLARRHRPARRRARRWSTRTGATSSRTTTSARTSSWTCASCSAPTRTSTATSAAARCSEMSDWVEYLTRDGDSPMARLRRENGRDEPWKVPFWGIGNEAWGCGGNMTAEQYARGGAPLRHVLPQPRRQRALPHRRRRVRRRHHVDARAHGVARMPRLRLAAGARVFQGVSFHYYTHAGAGINTEPADRVHGRAVLRHDAQGARRRAGHPPARGRDGLVRPRPHGRPRPRRVGHLVERRAGHQPRLPVPAEHRARRARRRPCTSTPSTVTPAASRWRTSRRPSTCCRR